MNKRNIFRTLSVAALAAVMLTSCNNSAPKMDEKQEAAQPAGSTDMKIAFVEVDSIMSQYKFCKEYSLVLQKKSNNARNTLAAKEKQLQAAAANFQQKLQNNGFASRQQAESVQAAIQRQGQDLQERVGPSLPGLARQAIDEIPTHIARSLMPPCAILSRTSSRTTTSRRSTTSSSPRQATISSMPTSVMTSPWT